MIAGGGPLALLLQGSPEGEPIGEGDALHPHEDERGPGDQKPPAPSHSSQPARWGAAGEEGEDSDQHPDADDLPADDPKASPERQVTELQRKEQPLCPEEPRGGDPSRTL